MAGWAGGFAGAFIGKSGRSGSGVSPVSLRQPSGAYCGPQSSPAKQIRASRGGRGKRDEVSFPRNLLDLLKFAIRLILRHAFRGCYLAT